MSQYSQNKIVRRRTKKIKVGSVEVGGDAKISVQSMTNTLTSDVNATVKQINDLVSEGTDIVRVSCPDQESTKSLKEIINNVDVPIVADIHFHYKRAIEAADAGAACLRINPGNIGVDKIIEVIESAKQNNICMRIGVNAGSIDEKILKKYSEPCADALVESAIANIRLLEDNNFDNFKISVKASDVFTTIEAYEKLAKLCDYPFHVGLTEAGTYLSGSIKSSISIGNLLSQGIGDTIRVSLASDPVDEVNVAWEMLKSLKIRSRGVKIVACPSCSRQNFQVISTVNKLETELSELKEEVTLAVIGCYVNGPGESKIADVGVTGADPKHLIYLGGKPAYKVETKDLEKALVKEVMKIAENKRNTILKQ